MKRGIEGALLALAVLAVGWFYFWTARSANTNWAYGKRQTDYYNLLIDGWREGQLHMKVTVPEELLRVADPYDPDQRPPGVGMHDASFYRGKYYVYFGVAPAVTLMWPWQLITGKDLPLAGAVVLFTFGGFLASAALWLRVRRIYFPASGTLAMLAGVLALGIAALGPVLVRRPHVWELPISGGYCFAMLALGCLFEALHARRPARWCAGAGIFLGLAVASRATYLFALGAMLVPLWHWRHEARRELLRRALAGVLPLAVIGLALAAHNYARFGDALEFGQKYQFSAMYEAKVTHFAARYAPFNAWLYFWSPAQWSRYFPFIAVTKPAIEPAGYGGTEDVYGLWRNIPLVWLALAAPLAWWRREADARAILRNWLAAIVVLVLPMTVLLLFFFGAHARYMLDFAPCLVLLAVIGLLGLERALAGRSPWLRLPTRAAVSGAWVFSLGFVGFFSLTATQILKEKNPSLFTTLARDFNRLPAALERLAGTAPGPVVLDVQFGPLSPGVRQTLLTTGRGTQLDAVFVQLVDSSQVQIGVAHEGGGTLLSRPLALDLARPHRLHVRMGSLFPPETHPFFAGVPPADMARLKREVAIEVDDEIVLEGGQDFHPASPGEVGIAPDLNNNVLGRRFTGRVLSVAREASPALLTARAIGECVRLRLELPAPGEALAQPLVSWGARDRGDVLALRVLEPGKVKFVWQAGADAPIESAPMTLEPRLVREIFVRRVAAGGAERPTIALQVQVDGTLAWSRRVATSVAAGTTPVAGENVVGAAASAPRFAGKIHARETFADGEDPVVFGRGTLRMKLRFPRPPLNGRDPLLVIGCAGAGDFLVVDYATPGAVSFGLDHWGNGRMPQSPPVPIDFEVPHEIEISLGITPGPPASEAVHANWGDRVIVKLDGREVWSADVTIYVPAPGEYFAGRNPIGGSSCGPAFRGELYSATREAPPSPRK